MSTLEFLIWLTGFIFSFLSIMHWLYNYSEYKQITIVDIILGLFVSVLSWLLAISVALVLAGTYIPWKKVIFKNKKYE